MKQLIFLGFLLNASFNVFSQQADTGKVCPVITLEGPRNNTAPEGSKAVFKVKSFSKAYTKTHAISYKWVTVNGKIVDGENQNTVYVDTKGLLGEKLTVSVIISGLDAGCKSVETVSINIIKPEVGTVNKIVARPRP